MEDGVAAPWDSGMSRPVWIISAGADGIWIGSNPISQQVSDSNAI